MKKEVFNQIVMDNIDATLVSVILSNGEKLSRDLLIEGNKTTSTQVTFIRIEENYVAVRRKMDITYDYSGQTRKGDAQYADFCLGYEDIVALEFYEESIKQALDEKEMQRLVQQADPAAVDAVQDTIEQYRGKSEGELMEDLRRMIGQQRAQGILTDEKMQQMLNTIAPMLNAGQQQKMAQILGRL